MQPDIMCFGKKMQVCGILVGTRVDEVPENVFHTSSRINSTWGGALIDMVRVTKYLEIIDEENLVGNAAAMGRRIEEGMQSLAARLGDDMVTNIRGMGLYRAFDVPTTEARKAFLADAYKQGLLMVGSGQRSIRFRPPLNVSAKEIDAGLEIIERVLAGMR